MKISIKSIAAALVAVGILSVPVGAKSAASQQSRVSTSDRKWLMAAADGELKEVSLGHIVAKRADNSAVRKFARRMIQDHTKAQSELQKLAKSKGVMLPTHLGTKNRKALAHMARISPSRLSHDYIQNMVADHYKDVSDFSKEAKHGQDKDVRTWAAKTVPVLQMHLQMARTTARGVVSPRKS